MKVYNNIDMKGRLYNYALQTIDTDKGEAISGNVTLEVDADGTTVEIRYFGYPTYSSGKKNATYGILDSMMAGNYKTVVDDGDDADWLACTGSIDVSYFVSQRDNDDDLARSQKIRGAFINQNKSKEYKNSWKLDFLITRIEDIDADEEKGYPRYLKVGGYLVDDYNKRVMQVQFQARKEGAINYISGLEASAETPYYVSTWGKMSRTTRQITRKNAFGEDTVDEYATTSWTIEGMNPDPYDFGDDSAMTTEQYEALLTALDEHKASIKDKDSGTQTGTAKKKFSF